MKGLRKLLNGMKKNIAKPKGFNVIKKIIYRLFNAISFSDSIVSITLRRMLLNFLLDKKHTNLIIRSGVRLDYIFNLSLGGDISINHGCYFSCLGGVTIGDHVSIGHNTSIMSTEHSYADLIIPIKCQSITKAPVVIKDNVWIGANVTILAGVSIAKGTVVAAGAVVAKNIVEECTIIGGVPAKFIKSRL